MGIEKCLTAARELIHATRKDPRAHCLFFYWASICYLAAGYYQVAPEMILIYWSSPYIHKLGQRGDRVELAALVKLLRSQDTCETLHSILFSPKSKITTTLVGDEVLDFKLLTKTLESKYSKKSAELLNNYIYHNQERVLQMRHLLND